LPPTFEGDPKSPAKTNSSHKTAECLIFLDADAPELNARNLRHAIGITQAQMKKELLKGFSLLVVIIVLALMTAAASVNANAPASANESYAVVSR